MYREEKCKKESLDAPSLEHKETMKGAEDAHREAKDAYHNALLATNYLKVTTDWFGSLGT